MVKLIGGLAEIRSDTAARHDSFHLLKDEACSGAPTNSFDVRTNCMSQVGQDDLDGLVWFGMACWWGTLQQCSQAQSRNLSSSGVVVPFCCRDCAERGGDMLAGAVLRWPSEGIQSFASAVVDIHSFNHTLCGCFLGFGALKKELDSWDEIDEVDEIDESSRKRCWMYRGNSRVGVGACRGCLCGHEGYFPG